MNNDKLQITLNVLGTEFKLYIERSEEAYYRKFPQDKEYVEFIEKETGVPVKIISVGPDRAETIVR